MPNAEIVAIGSELLLGQIVDTNSAWMAQRLTNLGVDLYYKTVVGDNPVRMKDVISRALGRCDVVITGGGLGPTQDDLTREAVAEVTGRKLVLDQGLLDQIEQRFRRRGLIMTANNDRQAYMPEGAIPIENPNGTAPAFVVEDPRGVIFALPGVPSELKWLFDNEVVPYLSRRFKLSEVITYRVLKAADIGESSVDDRIGYLIAGSSNPTVGVLAHPGQVDVRIAAKARSVEDAMRLIEPVEREVRKLLGRHVFAIDDESMEDAVGKLLRERNTTIAVYEDMTAGLLAEQVQRASAEHFLGATIGSGPASIRRLMAHSRRPDRWDELEGEPEARVAELAWAVREYAEADLGLALHGVPDPSDTADNLASGRTSIAITDGTRSRTRTYGYGGKGRPDRTRLSISAMDLVRVALEEGME